MVWQQYSRIFSHYNLITCQQINNCCIFLNSSKNCISAAAPLAFNCKIEISKTIKTKDFKDFLQPLEALRKRGVTFHKVKRMPSAFRKNIFFSLVDRYSGSFKITRVCQNDYNHILKGVWCFVSMFVQS